MVPATSEWSRAQSCCYKTTELTGLVFESVVMVILRYVCDIRPLRVKNLYNQDFPLTTADARWNVAIATDFLVLHLENDSRLELQLHRRTLTTTSGADDP